MSLLGACSLRERGPWVTAEGRRLQGSEVIEYDGFNQCDQERVIFMRFFGKQYARDPRRILGQLFSVEGQPIEFAILEEVPSGAEPTGIHHKEREIYLDQSLIEDFLFIRLGNGRVEQWPRAEVPCLRE